MPTVLEVELDPVGDALRLRVRRIFDGKERDFAVRRTAYDPRPEDSIYRLRQRLPNVLEKFRMAVGRRPIELSDDQAMAAARHLNTFARAVLDILLGGVSPQRLTAHIWPALCHAAEEGDAVPVIKLRASAEAEQRASAAGAPLAWLLPLELLPLAEPPGMSDRERAESSFTQRMSHYLGFRTLIVRSRVSSGGQIGRGEKGPLPIHIVSYKGTDFPGVADQVNFLRDSDKHFSLADEWPDLDALDPAVAADGLAEVLKKPGALLHFCCHFRAAGPDESGLSVAEPFLEFGRTRTGGRLSVTLFELRGALAELNDRTSRRSGNKFIFLNACRSAERAGEGESLFDFLREKGYTKIVGGEALLPDRLAGKFAIQFYTALMRGQTTGGAMLQARRDLLESCQNPAGLLYTL